MRLALLSLLCVSACTQVFGLEPPTLCHGDNFNDNQIDIDRWGPYGFGTPQQVSERNHRLEIEIATGTLGYSGLQTRYLLEPADTAEIELVLPNLGFNTQSVVGLVVDGYNAAFLSKYESDLLLSVLVGGTADNIMTPFDTTAHRYWRIQHDADQAIFSTSSDGMTWIVNRTASAAWGQTPPTIVLYAGENAPANGGVVAFDNFKIVTESCMR